MKRCPKCGETKPLSKFSTRTVRNATGESEYPVGYCRACQEGLTLQWRRDNRERYLAYMRAYYRRRKAEQAAPE